MSKHWITSKYKLHDWCLLCITSTTRRFAEGSEVKTNQMRSQR
ncbi:hypothetical protein NC652_005639 [Populus alba x Populus x berolinensis]|nr:hypothetical protein NC652_005639 [Populus alba x Populus x berolinensis]